MRRLRDISLYAEPVKYDPVEIDLVDITTDKVIGDTYLMDTNEASDVFSGHNKYQTILFIVIIIFVVMLIICLSGNFLGLNSHFQKILATVNKITASIKTLLPAALPAVAQAATITHGDVELHINYFDILMYAIQIMIVMKILFGYVYIFGIVLIPEILVNYKRNLITRDLDEIPLCR